MTWQELLADHRVQRHVTSRQEITDLRALVERDLADARLEGLSADRRFATAYNAALQLATIALAGAGYRTASASHHQTTFAALPLAIDQPGVGATAAYLDICRRKRNALDYTRAGVATECEAAELLGQVSRLQALVESWLRDNHPRLIGDR
jgi:hypothetical protein